MMVLVVLMNSNWEDSISGRTVYLVEQYLEEQYLGDFNLSSDNSLCGRYHLFKY